VRPSGPVGGMPAATPRPPLQAVRPSGPVGGLPAAPRPSLPLPVDPRLARPPGSLPAARPATSPVGSGAPISLSPFAKPAPKLPAQPSTKTLTPLTPGGYQPADPELVRKLGEPWAPAPVRPGVLPPTPPPLPKPRPATVPQYITVTEKILNPQYSGVIKPVPASQTVMLDKYGVPTGQVGTRVPMNSPAAVPKWITVQRQVLNPAYRAPPALAPGNGAALGPTPATQSFALQARRAMTPVTQFQAQGLSSSDAYAAANAAAAAKAQEKSKYSNRDSSSGFGNSTASSDAAGRSLYSSIS
jgi:hypothetical protein